MQSLSVDIETYCDVDLLKAGLYRYVQDPSFEILMLAYSIDDSPSEIVDFKQGENLPADIVYALQDDSITKYAYNAAFEWYALNKFYKTPIQQWQDTMLHGMYCGYTAGLGPTAEALGLSQDKQKMKEGKALIKLFCTPTKPTKKNGHRQRTLPHHEPEKWELFKEYCKQDVEVEKEIGKKLKNFPIPQQEQKLWELDQQINATGIAADKALIDGALYINRLTTDRLTEEAQKITGLDNPNSEQQLKKWLSDNSLDVPNLQKATVADLVDQTTGDVRRMLEIRLELAKTSVKKYEAMNKAYGNGGRIRGLLQFYGANRTGRWAGRLVQVQNLPRNHMASLGTAREMVRNKNETALRLIYGNVPDTLSQLVRTAFVPSEGNILAVSDFSSIEPRVLSWLAGEQWRLDVFNTHGKIYEASASSMFGVPIEEITKGSELRDKGKISELALGYQGSTGALMSMGALDMGIDEDELPDIVKRWRSANKRIVDFWYSVERAAVSVLEDGQPVGIKGLLFQRESDIINGLDFLTITLPSGRKLYYVKPFLAENSFGKQAVHHWGMDQYTRKFTTMSTYGGKLVENIVQAVSRDCLAVAMQRMADHGYQTVMHVHDELVLDVPRQQADIDEIDDIMGQPIDWAEGLNLKADGFLADFYMKD